MAHYIDTSSGADTTIRGGITVSWPFAASLVALVEIAAIAGLSWSIGGLYFALAFETVEAGVSHALFGVFVALAFAAISLACGHYGFERFFARNPLDHTVLAWSGAFLLGLAGLFLLKAGGEVSRAGVVGFYAFGLLALAAWRTALRRLGLNGLREGWLASRRVLLIGGQGEIDGFVQGLHDSEPHGLAVAGMVATTSANSDCEAAVKAVRSLRPDGIVLLTAWSEPAEIERWVDALSAVPVTIHLGPPPGLARFRAVPLGWHSVLSDLVLVRAPLSRGERLVKRLFDILVAGLALIVLAPLFLLIAALIRLDSKGPALFRQPRHGFNHDVFEIYKFRTMAAGEEANGFRQAVPGDRRVTRLGRYLRRWNLDELPQLINVLKGEMSIVGPRPHPLDLDNGFAARIAHYARRHNMKPGITGWAQVNGLRGPTETEDKMRARVAHDLYYIDNWSLWLDIKIVVFTLCSPRAFENAC